MAASNLSDLDWVTVRSCAQRPRSAEYFEHCLTVDADIERAWLDVLGHAVLLGRCEDTFIETRLGSIFLMSGTTSVILKAGLNIYARFVQRSRLEAAGDIVLEGSCLHSQLSAGGVILSEDPEGKAIGGKLRAVNAVKVACLGNPNGTQTEIELVAQNAQVLTSRIHPMVRFSIAGATGTIRDDRYAEFGLKRVYRRDGRVFVQRLTQEEVDAERTRNDGFASGIFPPVK